VSAVQLLPSSTARAVPAWQWPEASHFSRPSHTVALSQAVPAEATVCVTPDAGEHESIVHGFPSSTTSGVPATHAPLASQRLTPLQTLPSSQDVPLATGTCFTPSVGEQESAVQGLPSSTAGGVAAGQWPAPSQTSEPLHAFESEQEVPEIAGVCVTP
jgi:hypothetical protein